MAMPSSGVISLDDARRELSLTGVVDTNNIKVRTLFQARYGNPVIFSNGYGRSLVFDFPDSAYLSPYGSNVTTPRLTLTNFFTPGQLANGDSFIITSKIIDTNTSWAYQTPYSWTWQKASTGGLLSQTATPRVNRKQFFMQPYYDTATQELYISGYYSGSSTDFPNGQVTITRIELLL
jgi:hypothetical protein